ncbi:MAG: hypothetical protein R2747_12370 [Pyrinomonadaceae bacterium]
MSKNIKLLLRAAAGLSLALIVIAIGSYIIVAQTTTGTWEAKYRPEKEDKIHFSFSRETEKNHKNSFGSDFEFKDFQGLTRQDALGSNTKVQFSLVREAGTINCEGTFQDGRGSGTFTFTPNASFVSAMESRGFKNLSEEKLFASTTLDVTTSFVDDVLSMGFQDLDYDDIFKARIFKVTPQFAAEMTSIGFPNLNMEDLVKARIFKIDSAYAREIAGMGFKNDSLEGLVKFRIFKVTPEFLREVQAEGLVNLSGEDVVKLRIFKIDGAFIRQARTENVPITVEALVNKRIGVWSRN